MLPGPVFNVELMTTARRARYFLLRFVYGAILLVVVWENNPANYEWYYGATPTEMTIERASVLGYALFTSFAVTQSIAVLLMTPALVAGVIAEEKQRKTLHYLLASRLTSDEIVVGKLCARLLHVGVLLGVGLPILSLLSLFGGVAPKLIALTFVATLTAVFFVGALSILVSTYARRPREAIGLVYALEMVWLFVPLIVSQTMPYAGRPWTLVYEWIQRLNALIGTSSPLYFLFHWRLGGAGNAAGLYEWMVGLQAGVGVACLAAAVLRLRPVFRKQGDSSRWAARIKSLKEGRRLLPRPECGDDAMLWKERYVSRTSLATKVVGGFVLLLLGGMVAYAAYQVAVPAFQELWEYGYGWSVKNDRRAELNVFVRFLSVLTYLAWVLGVASAASGSIVHEREADTWTSLIATPLGGDDIVFAKMIGAVWGTRWIGVVLLALDTMGLAAGAVHPWGYVGSLLETAVFIWFAAALGTFISLRARNSGRAMTATVGILVLLNGGYLLFCTPVWTNSPFIVLGVTPALEAMSLISYEELVQLFNWEGRVFWSRHMIESAWACVAGTLGYGVAALALTASAANRFDDVIDRPRRLGQRSPIPSTPRKPATVDDSGITFVS